jgi:hypothetical protein
MENRVPPDNATPPAPSCANCIHAFKQYVEPGIAICVPHLKLINLNDSATCDLYSMVKKKSKNDKN